MHATETMLRSHPRADARRIHSSARVIDALAICAAACAMCADACLTEDEHVLTLRRCVRLNLECADACVVTGRMLSRQAEIPGALLHGQLQVCVRACQFCADECQGHAREHRHCRICAEICRGAQAGCGHLLGVFSSEAVGESVKPLDRAGLRR